MKNSVKRTNRIFTGFKSSQDMSLKVDQCFGSIDRSIERERERETESDVISFKYITLNQQECILNRVSI